jgi:hypothetical protein
MLHGLNLARVVTTLIVAALPALAQEKKPDDKKPTPRVISITPFTVTRGQTNTLHIRGINLADASAIRVEGSAPALIASIKSKGPIDNPKKSDPARTGDSQIVIDLPIPADAAPDSLNLIVETKNGDTKPQSILVFNPGALINEKEPNGGFQTAQEIRIGQTVRGAIEETGDVDVFKFQARAGDRLIAEVDAARHGSQLDSLLTLYATAARELASNDDSANGADSLLTFTIPADGTYYLSLSDANGTGSAAHGYLLTLRAATAATKPTTGPKKSIGGSVPDRL